jgi:hydrophobe/amphiphile efflux-1 (HAE1) family protein
LAFDPKPGETTPHDTAKPGDAARLRGADNVAGDHAPQDSATPADEQKLARESHGEAEPLGGVNFSEPFIKRPVATFLMSIAIIIAGSVAYKLLPVASLPQVEFPVIAVGAALPGADPNTMASSVATPLERQFSRIAGVNQMTSASSVGATSITMQFDLSRDINGAARDVQAAINAARAQLPANLPTNPTYRKLNPADAPILILTLTSDTATIPQMYDISDSILAQKIAQVQGVGQTFTGGSAKPAVRVEVNPNALTSEGIGLEALRSAITGNNVERPTGYINGIGPDSKRIAIYATDQLHGAAAYGPLIVATDKGPVSSAAASNALPKSVASSVNNSSATTSTTASNTGSNVAASPSTTTTTSTATNTAATGSSGGNNSASSNASTTKNFATTQISTVGAANEHGLVRVSDVANVVNSVEDIHTGGYWNSRPAILVVVFKAPGANVIKTVDNVLKILPQLQGSIPPSMKLQVVLDRTTMIRSSVKDVTRTLILSTLLVVLVVFVFLRETRSTLIPSVSVPLSLLGTFGVMYLLGYTLDNLSLMALTISTGFVVDDAIVVIENISRHLEAGLTPFDAAMKGAREIGFTVLSMSTSLIAVFIPILLMGGIVGRLFREFAVTLSVAIAVSLVVSLTTTPMLSAKFLKPHSEVKKGWFFRKGEKHLAFVTDEYARGLRWVLNHQGITLLVFILTFVMNIYLFVVIPKGFFPQQDTGRLAGQIRAQQDTSFYNMREKMKQMMDIVKSDPGVDSGLSFLGGGGPGGSSSNQANMFVVLKSAAERHKTGDTPEKIIDRLRPATTSIPGVTLFMQSSQELSIGGRPTATQYQYTLTADSNDDLNVWSPKLMAAMQQLPQLKDVATDLQSQGLEAHLVIDRDTASRLGVSALAIDATLSDAFGQRQVSTTYMPLNQYHVVMEVDQPFQNDPGALSKIYVKSTSGAEIPLSAITHLETTRIPLAVNHQSLSPAATLSFNLAPNVALSEATTAIENARVKVGMPSNIAGGFQGTAEAAKASFASVPLLVFLAIFTVYIVLGILYESFIHPITILSTLPSAGVGAFLALILFHEDFSVIAMIGIILLIGIVKKNAIMMIDFALVAERQHGKTPREAIYEACLLRFRPIMMTTMAALLGGIPLALGTGTGSELRRPLGIAIVGGLIVSQCLTLFTTPVIYLFFDRLRLALPRWRHGVLESVGLRSHPVALPSHTPAD